MAKLAWGQRSPGHLIFLIDQSSSMNMPVSNGKNRAEIVSDAVQTAFIDCMNGCISGTKIKNRFFLTIIGYGGSVCPQAKIIKEGWVGSFVSELQEIKSNGGQFIPSDADGFTPMAEAFDLAKECLEGWLEACQEKVDDGSYLGIPAPVVINITDSEPCDGSSTAKDRAISSAKKILSLYGTDENVTLFNIHISNEGEEIICPESKIFLKRYPEGALLFDISSEVSIEMSDVVKVRGIDICKGAKCFAYNVKQDSLAPLLATLCSSHISFGSGNSMPQRDTISEFDRSAVVVPL